MSAADALGKQFHGTDVELQPGDKVLPRAVTGARLNAVTYRDTSSSVSTTAHLPEAARYGQNVYVVAPVNPRPDPEYRGAAHRLHPQAAQGTYDADEAVVVRRVSPEATTRAAQFRALPRDDGVPRTREQQSRVDRRMGWGDSARDEMARRARRRRGQ